MTESKNANEWFDTLARILLRCFVLGYILLLIWFLLYAFGGEQFFGFWARLFGITQREMDLINFSGIVFMKSLVLVFFLCPYIAIRWVLRKGN